MKVATHNFPNIKEHGDVFKADFTQYKGVDYLIGGSPCTYWSIAQKNNRETTASGLGWELFSQYVRALKEAKPKWFLYENNKSMSDAIRQSISNAFGFEPICINSALVSAQNRKRLYWCGKSNGDGTYSKVNIEQPIDRGIVLKDILENGERIPQYGNIDKSRPVEALYNNHAGTGEGSLVASLCSDNPIKQQVDLVAEPIRIGALPRPNGELSSSQAMRIYSVNGKSVNLTSNGGGLGGKTGLYAIPSEILTPFVESKLDDIVKKYGYLPEHFNAYNKSEIIDKTPTITACANRQSNSGQGMSVAKSSGGVYPVYVVQNNTITIKNKKYPIKLQDGFYIIRKLYVTECKKLQTVPEWYDMTIISDSQAYKCLGNGWTVDVITYLLGHMK